MPLLTYIKAGNSRTKIIIIEFDLGNNNSYNFQKWRLYFLIANKYIKKSIVMMNYNDFGLFQLEF